MQVLLFAAWLAAYAADMERPAAVAGRFYPGHAQALTAQVDHFLHKAEKARPGKVVALLVPHAGLEFSGPAAATAWNAVEPGEFDTVLLIGAAHYVPVEGAALFPGAYATPLGRVEYDRKLGDRLLKDGSIRSMPEAHDREHSIEVNVTFLQRRFPKARLVALVMNAEDLATAERVGRAVAKAVKGRRVLIAASTDLSHYPPGDVADRVDTTTLHALASLDPAFFHSVNRFHMSRGHPNLQTVYCGEGAATAVLVAAKALGATEARVLSRYNSGDALTEKVYREVVGYAAVAFVAGPRSERGAYGLSEDDKRALLGEARETLRRELDGTAQPPVELSTRPAFNLPAAVFVTWLARGETGPAALRGCIGTTEPRGMLLESVRFFALEAGLRDARFPPIERERIDEHRIEISILTPPKPVASAEDIQPRVHGVMLENRGRRGLFLPQVWESLPDKDRFLAELCAQKAGLPANCVEDPSTRLQVFRVESFEDH
ncbi:MAG: AmmeMemoRadiSam system protein B [Elusimicrobia bacterium]|nr:AmmeMemoRadiSam system protein B [Elusimicrobiota bacterium]